MILCFSFIQRCFFLTLRGSLFSDTRYPSRAYYLNQKIQKSYKTSYLFHFIPRCERLVVFYYLKMPISHDPLMIINHITDLMQNDNKTKSQISVHVFRIACCAAFSRCKPSCAEATREPSPSGFLCSRNPCFNVNDMNRHEVRDHRYHVLWSCEMDVLSVDRSSGKERLSMGTAPSLKCFLHCDGRLAARRLHRESER